MYVCEPDFYCKFVQKLRDLELQLFKVSLIIAQQNIAAALLFGVDIYAAITYLQRNLHRTYSTSSYFA